MMPIVLLLFNSLWQSALLLFAAAVALRVTRNSNATTRYMIWTIALAGSVLFPVITTLAASSSAERAAAPAPSSSSSIAHVIPRQVASHAIQPAVEKPAAATALASIPRMRLALSPVFAIVVIAAWALAAGFNAIRLILSLGVLESLKRNAVPLPVEYRRRLARWQSIAGTAHRVRLCLSDEISVPVAVGLFDAMILLPRSLVDELSADDVDRIVLHEYAHLTRGDDWINAFERAALALFFFNPAIRYIARQMEIEREVSCDDSVLLTDGDAVPMAACLVNMVEKVAWPYQALAAPGVFDTRRNVSLRVERLLTAVRDRRTRVSAIPTIGAAATMFALVLAGTAVSPLLVSALPQPQKHVHVQKIAKAHAAVKKRPVIAATRSTKIAQQLPAMVAKPRSKISAPKISAPKIIASVTPAPKPKQNCTCRHSSGSTTSQRGDYIDELASVGYKNLTVDQLVQLRDMGVTAEYIRWLNSAGFSAPSVRELIEARVGNVTPAYLQAMRSRVGALSLSQLGELGTLGVTPEYIDELASAGYRGLSARQLQELRSLGVDRAFIDSAHAHGFQNLTIEQLVRLKASGVL